MIRENVIRGPVVIGTNRYGSVYEATEDPDKFIVNLYQLEVWFEGHKRMEKVLTVPIKTGVCIYKKNQVVIGNICTMYQLHPVIEDEPDEHLLYLNNEQVLTHEGYPIWSFMYYSPSSKHTPVGELQDTVSLWDVMSLSV